MAKPTTSGKSTQTGAEIENQRGTLSVRALPVVRVVPANAGRAPPAAIRGWAYAPASVATPAARRTTAGERRRGGR